MTKIEFSEGEKLTFYEGFCNHPHHKVRLKMHCMYLKSLGFSTREILKISRVARSTYALYVKAYNEKGIVGLTEIKYEGQRSKLDAYRDKVKDDFRDNPPATLSQARDRIFELTGIKRSIPQIREFLGRLGLRRLKTGSLPGGHKGNTEEKRKEQKTFLETELKPRLQEAKSGKRIVLFVDAAHFVHGAFMSFVWSFNRIFIGTPPGRKRYNVLGAVNAVSLKLTMVDNDSYINAKSVCKLLRLIYDRYFGLPITLVLDNARYQKCKLVRRYAKILGIELLYLPSYSPQLNLIERLWKHVKKKVLHGEYYPNFKQFRGALKDFLTSLEHSKDDLKPLLSWNFQTFENVRILT